VKIAEIREKFPMYKDMSDRELVKGLHKAHYSDMDYAQFLKKIDFSERVDPTDGMSGTEKFAAGAGKAVADLGLGVRQLGAKAADFVSPREQTLSGLVTGNDNSRSAEIQKEVDEVKGRDKALMDTGAGFTGNIAGNVAMSVLPGLGLAGIGKAAGQAGMQAAGKALLASPATFGGAATQATMGAVQSGLQPVATGESRAGNTALGAVGGALVPVAGMALKGVKSAVEPLYEGGRQQILARTLRGAAGEGTDDVISKLAQAKELVPGSLPTAGEAAGSGGIAALQRAASAIDPEAYAARGMQQNEARVAALQSLAGTDAQRASVEGARAGVAAPAYKKAFDLGFDPAGVGVPKEATDQLASMAQRPAVQQAIASAKQKALNEGIDLGEDMMASPRGVDYIKRAIDDQMAGAAPDDVRILKSIKDSILGTADNLSPEYAAARQAFAAASKPVNQMDVASQIADKSINKLTGVMQPQAYAKALSDDTAASATGFNKATLANTMEPNQLASLNAIKDDLARSVQARDLGRGAGSDTVQKLAMTNLMEQSGIPVGALNLPGVGRVGNWLYSNADDKMQSALAKALLDPKETSSIMLKGAPNQNKEALISALRMSLAPAAVGTAPALLDAR
jgi:hypothetical protein